MNSKFITKSSKSNELCKITNPLLTINPFWLSLKNQSETDITLWSSDKSCEKNRHMVGAHKKILTERSRYFRVSLNIIFKLTSFKILQQFN